MESFDIRLIVGLILGILVGYGMRYFLSLRKSNSIEQRAEKLEAKANQKAQEIILIARQDAVNNKYLGQGYNSFIVNQPYLFDANDRFDLHPSAQNYFINLNIFFVLIEPLLADI